MLNIRPHRAFHSMQLLEGNKKNNIREEKLSASSLIFEILFISLTFDETGPRQSTGEGSTEGGV